MKKMKEPIRILKSDMIERAMKRFPDMEPDKALWHYRFTMKLNRMVKEWGEDASEVRGFIYESMKELDELEMEWKQLP